MSEYVVQTKSGRIKGYERSGIIEYLGIPYAKPPVGPLRFKRAAAIDPWDDVFDAQEYGPVPVQFDKGEKKGSEDCLTINVQRPKTEECNLPVIVYFYGGGYNTGSASDPLYNGLSFAKDGLVFVSFQYRLNVLGFYDFTTYPGCEDFESNCGLSDQLLAMQWIHDNIRAFGGDPDRITIFGESAGGASVVNMLAAPKAKGLFSQAIIQSALPNCVMTHHTARQNIDIFLEAMGWDDDEIASHLKHDDPYTFFKGNEEVARRHQYKNPGMFLPGPVQDDLLPIRPLDAIRGGSSAGVKIIIGTTKHEGTMFVYPENTGFPNSYGMISEMLERNGHAAAIPDFISYYENNGNEFGPFVNFATDYAFKVPAVKLAKGQKQWNDDVWMYSYELVTKGLSLVDFGATHASELPAVFAVRSHEFSNMVFDGENSDLFEEISARIHGDWVRFAKEGTPDEKWERFSGDESVIRIYDRTTEDAMVDRSELMGLWKDLRFWER